MLVSYEYEYDDDEEKEDNNCLDADFGFKKTISMWNSPKIDVVPIRISDTIRKSDLVFDRNVRTKEPVHFVEQYVKAVVDFSSQYGSSKSFYYSAYNIVGYPTKFPDYGDFPESFVMRTYGKWWDEAPSRCTDYMPQNNGPVISHDYIVLEFEMAVFPLRISIIEVYNPGSVIAIWAKNESGQWLRLWSGPPQVLPPKSRIFSPPLQKCNFKTNILRLEFNHSFLDYYTQLDAVLMIGTAEQLILNAGFGTHNLSSLLRKLGKANHTNKDYHNLTPDCAKVNEDLLKFKRMLQKKCVLHKNMFINKLHITKLTAKVGFHRHHIPPIEEAFNSLHEFLQDDFPKLVKDINVSSSITFTESDSEINVLNINSTDDFNFLNLPYEIVLKIFKNLDLKSLCRCSQVNRQFNMMASDALLYKRLNFKPYWHLVNSTVLNNFTTKCQYLQQLDFSWCGNFDAIQPEDFVNFLQANGNSLTHLRLNCCSFVNNDVVKEISVCTKLKELGLGNCVLIDDDGFVLLSNLKNLEILDLYKTNLKNSETLCSILHENPHLQHLNLACCSKRLLMDDVAEELATSCTKLESIDMWKSSTLTVRGVRALANCSNLKEIDFGWCSGVGPLEDSLRLLFKSCRNLEKVFLAALRGLTDRDLEPLLLCHNLKQLDILGANSVSPETCTSLLNCLPLRMIDLSFCDGISEAKVQEWRQAYPFVSIKRSFQI